MIKGRQGAILDYLFGADLINRHEGFHLWWKGHRVQGVVQAERNVSKVSNSFSSSKPSSHGQSSWSSLFENICYAYRLYYSGLHTFVPLLPHKWDFIHCSIQ